MLSRYMEGSFRARFEYRLKSAVFVALICFCVGVANQRAPAGIVVYTFQQYDPGNYPFTGTGNIVVDSGNLVGGELSFNFTAPTPFSAWLQPSWNGSYLSAGIFNTGVGTVLATGPGQPAVQVFNSLTQGTTIVGTWVEVPEPAGLPVLLIAVPAVAAAAHRRKRVSA
jgi:hypothetical protein